MNEAPNLISVFELKKLLIELQEKRPDICFRYRLLGEMWVRNFMHIVRVTAKGALLIEEISNRLVTVPDLSLIMQFELDNRFQTFQPLFHYEVKPTAEDVMI